MIHCIIVDDEQHCIDTLKWQLEEYCKNDIKIVGSYTDAVVSIPEIIRLKPELVFSDIKMPEMSGLELAARIGDVVKHIVFTTAFDKYAINAIKLNVADYLLKPIDKDELITTIQKIKNSSSLKDNDTITRSKLHNKLTISNNDGIMLLDYEDILYVEASGAYSIFHLKNLKKIVISKTLSQVEEMILDDSFMRIHKSYIIHLKHLEKYMKGDGGEVVLTNGTTLPVSRNKKEALLNILRY